MLAVVSWWKPTRWKPHLLAHLQWGYNGIIQVLKKKNHVESGKPIKIVWWKIRGILHQAKLGEIQRMSFYLGISVPLVALTGLAQKHISTILVGLLHINHINKPVEEYSKQKKLTIKFRPKDHKFSKKNCSITAAYLPMAAKQPMNYFHHHLDQESYPLGVGCDWKHGKL